MTLHLSVEQARRFLALYHFAPTDIAGVLDRLGTIQYDPLNPVGRNPDLVLQARVPGYQVDDWQQVAYTNRVLYDSWDKQACLVPVSDWPNRALIREKYRPYHDREILENEAALAQSVLATIDERGPLSSQEFDDREHFGVPGSWSGTTRTNRILRALWVNGQLVTHHRQSGRHYYDRPERVIPAPYYNVRPLLDEDAYHRWIMLRRYTAVGLLRKTAEAAVWACCGDSKQRDRATLHLVETGELTPVLIGDKPWQYYMPTSALPLLDSAAVSTEPPEMRFLAPLDSLLWDRKGIQHIFDFAYTWEVYKPEHLRTWGYYVLPVFYGDRFVARIDSRLDKGVWNIARWWWEPGIVPDADLMDALREAASRFVSYLRADDIKVGEGVEEGVRAALGDRSGLNVYSGNR